MMKLKLELDADQFDDPVDTVGDLFALLAEISRQNSDISTPLGVMQPAATLYAATGARLGRWSITDGVQTDGTEPGNGLARLEAERVARAQ